MHINWLKLLKGERVYLSNISEEVSEMFREIKGDRSYLQIFNESNFSSRSAYHWKDGTRPIPLDALNILLARSNTEPKKLMAKSRLSFGSGSAKKLCSLPCYVDSRLAYLVGFLMGDGCLMKNNWTIGVCNEYESEIRYIEQILKELFDLSGKKIRNGNKRNIKPHDFR